MRKSTSYLVGGAIAAALIGAWGYRQATRPSQPPAENAVDDSPDLIVGRPIRFKNLTIFPVASKVARNQDRFITLAEGLASGKVQVSELGARPARQSEDPFAADADVSQAAANSEPADNPFAGPNPPPNAPDDETGSEQYAASDDVNQLLVTNRSDAPLYLMPGEIIVGGNQDRAIAEELIVPPHTERMAIPVYCVEHGRWASRSQEETIALAERLSDNPVTYPAASLVTEPAEGRFSVAGGYLNKTGRLTVQAGKGQSEVWDAISKVNAQTWAPTDSDAFTANYTAPEVADKLEPYTAALKEPIAKTSRVVGVIVAVNGEIQAADTFESTPLFRKLWPKLLGSYVLDAVMQADEQDDRAPTCKIAQAETFLDDAMQAKVAESTDRDGLVTTRGDAEGLASFSLHESRDHAVDNMNVTAAEAGQGAGMMGGMGGGMTGGGNFGSGVHSAAFAR